MRETLDEYRDREAAESRRDERRELSERFQEAPTNPLECALASIDADVENWSSAAMARGLLRGYDSQWRESQRDMRLLSMEQMLQASLVNLNTGAPSRTFRMAGKIDKLCELSSRRKILVDHKTTSMEIENPDSTYWSQLVIDSQPSHYELLLHLNGIQIDYVLWDVIRKPGIRPKKLSKADATAVSSLHEYAGFRVSESGSRVSSDMRENAELYEHRVARESIDNPTKYFARRNAKRTNDELAEYGVELWDVATEMREARNHGRHYRNAGSCFNYGSPCRFLGVCSGHDTVDSDNWTRAEQVHNELDVNGDGKDLLTNSRLKCFQTCRRKHYYEYELGVRKVDEEEREALYFGTMFHAALDLYWERSTIGATL